MSKQNVTQTPGTQPRTSDKPEDKTKTEALVDELLDKVTGGGSDTKDMCGDCTAPPGN
jgi:hypothetical protein